MMMMMLMMMMIFTSKIWVTKIYYPQIECIGKTPTRRTISYIYKDYSSSGRGESTSSYNFLSITPIKKY
jgi:hypothetical protein